MDLDRIKKAVSNVTPADNIISRYGWDNPKYADLETPARNVMSAYQNANRWLDTLKERLLIDMNCPNFSYIVHQLAHTMPVRFDAFGDILHTQNLEVPYPSTEEWVQSTPDVAFCINAIYDILDKITESLVVFKKSAESVGLMSMSIDCDALISELAKEYVFYHRALSALEYYGSHLADWDKYVYEYWKNPVG